MPALRIENASQEAPKLGAIFENFSLSNLLVEVERFRIRASPFASGSYQGIASAMPQLACFRLAFRR